MRYIFQTENGTVLTRSHGSGNERVPTESTANILVHHVNNMFFGDNACVTGKGDNIIVADIVQRRNVLGSPCDEEIGLPNNGNG